MSVLSHCLMHTFVLGLASTNVSYDEAFGMLVCTFI